MSMENSAEQGGGRRNPDGFRGRQRSYAKFYTTDVKGFYLRIVLHTKAEPRSEKVRLFLNWKLFKTGMYPSTPAIFGLCRKGSEGFRRSFHILQLYNCLGIHRLNQAILCQLRDRSTPSRPRRRDDKNPCTYSRRSLCLTAPKSRGQSLRRCRTAFCFRHSKLHRTTVRI